GSAGFRGGRTFGHGCHRSPEGRSGGPGCIDEGYVGRRQGRARRRLSGSERGRPGPRYDRRTVPTAGEVGEPRKVGWHAGDEQTLARGHVQRLPAALVRHVRIRVEAIATSGRGTCSSRTCTVSPQISSDSSPELIR